jgi:hypothetical protein
VLLFSAAALLGACNNNSGSPTDARSSARVKAAAPANAGPTVAQLTSGMVMAAVQGKSPLPVDLKFELLQRPIVGQALDINLALIPHVDAGPVSIQLSGTEGFTLNQGSAQFDLPAVQAEQVYRETANLTPNAEGVLVLAVTVSAKHEEVSDIKVFSIPLIVDR